MKQRARFFLIALSQFFVALTLVILCLPQPSQAKEIKQVKLSSFYYPPFYFIENGMIQGIAVDLVNELFGRLQINVDLRLYPLQRALKNLEYGESDAMMILIKTPDREKFLHYTAPVTTVRGLIWRAADRNDVQIEYKSLSDLRPYTIGVTRGYSYGEAFDRFLHSHPEVEIAGSDLQNYKKLVSHRIDLFPGNEIVAKGLFKQYPELKEKLTHSQKSFIEWVLHMGISKRSELVSLTSQINSTLADLTREGFIDQTIQKYTE